MGSFGQRLQREREMRGITLEEIANSTKIGTRSLRALEEEDFDQLPGGIFNKGFVRAYAKYLGIDEEQAVADYMTAAGEGDPPLPNPPEKPPETPAQKKSRTGAWLALLVIVALAAGAFYGWRWFQRKSAEENAQAQQAVPAPLPPPSTKPAEQAQVAEASPSPDASATPSPDGTQAAPTPAPAPDKNAKTPELAKGAKADGFLLEIHAKQDAWIQYVVDDKPGKEVNMKADDQQSIHAQKMVTVTVGNAAGVEISHNGKALPQLGGKGKRVKLVFTPEGLQR
jgi:cytoskeleton protein RodZ